MPKFDDCTHVEDYQVQTHGVSSATTLYLKSAPGGGECVLIEKR